MRVCALTLSLLSSLFLIGCSQSQQIVKGPTKTASPSSQREDNLIKDGIAAHDRQDYDEAIKHYDAALRINSENPLALFELAFTYSAKNEHQRSLDLGCRVAEYNVPFLDQVYTLIGNELDFLGRVKDAIAVYEFALEKYPNKYLIHYNLGVALVEAGNVIEGKTEFKAAIRLRPSHASSHFFLGKICEAQRSRIPALMAYCRFLILQPVSQRTQDVQESIRRLVLGSVERDSARQNTINVSVDPNTPKDDGDFGMLGMMLALKAAYEVGERDTGQTEVEKLTECFKTIFAMMGGSHDGFAWEYYAPYFSELNSKGYVDAFVDHIFRIDKIRKEELDTFLKWSDDYRWQSDAY